MKFFLRCTAALAVILSLPFDALAAPQTLNNCRTLTEPGAYVLGRNISSNGDCFVVGADFVNVDLDGFVVSGNGTGFAFVEQAGPARRGFTLRNGVGTGFNGGVSMTAASATVIDRMTFTANTGVAIAAGDMVSVSNSMLLNNGAGMQLGSRALVSGNTVNQNAFNGISAGIGSSVIGNAVGQNGLNGIALGEGGLLVNNISRNNTRVGASMECPATAVGNTLSNNLVANLAQPGEGECNDLCCIVTGHNSTINSF
jgi:hypothetical protein